MASTARNATQPIPVSRTLKQGLYFVCGICRKPHGSKEKGNACVNKCFASFTAGNLVAVTRQWGRDSFRCKLCTRTYALEEPAQLCATGCLSRMQEKLPPMPKMRPDGTYAVQADAPRAQRKPVVRAAPPPPAPRPQVQRAPQAPKPSVVSAPAPAPEVAAAPPPPPEVKVKKPPRDRTKKFHRDGAKYVCQECNVKYFTKAEVEVCFDGHPD